MPQPRRLEHWITATPIAHRGLHRLPDTPENSRAAFQTAIEAGYAIEIDVRPTADGQVVVFHDKTLDRLTDGSGGFAERTWAEIRDLRLLGTAETIPSFQETLDFVAGRAPLLVEIKNDAPQAGALEEKTLRLLKSYAGPFAVQSFSTETVAFFQQHAPEIACGQLASNDDWHAKVGDTRLPDFIAYNLAALPTPLSTRYRTAGVPLLAWTIQTPEQREKARQFADNVIFEGVAP